MIKGKLEERVGRLSNEEKKLVLYRLKNLLATRGAGPTPGNSKKLVAYVRLNENFSKEDFRRSLKKDLPDHMIPSEMHFIDEMPLLPNGKIDKNSLKKLQNAKRANGGIRKPDSQIEKQLAQIWEEVLDFSPIDIHDNFFEIGGDSILSIQIIAEARKLGMMIAPHQLFEHQTIKSLAESIEAKSNIEEKWEFITALRKGGTKKPLFCIHSGGGHVFFYGLLKDHLEADRPIYAVQPSGLYGNEGMHMSVEEMTLDYLSAIREIQPRGPYNILVHCFSTSVGNEMSKLLEQVGEEINIIVIDTMASPWNATDKEAMKVRIMSFMRRILMSPIKTLKMFFEDRKYIFDAIFVRLFGKDYQKDLEKLKANLRRISVEYTWEKHQGKVSLILTEKPDKKFQEYIINSWQKYALGGVKIYPTKGNHTTLFQEPDVQYVAEKIDECIID